MGNQIPGIRIDGMNVMASREGMRFAKEYCGAGNGPMYVEQMTYRYHGHSMSDPGTTYRNRDEIEFTRSNRDPIEHVKSCLVEAGFMTAEEIKKAKAMPEPEYEEVASEIYAKSLKPNDSTL